jgi:predicted nucleic acid-binding protein
MEKHLTFAPLAQIILDAIPTGSLEAVVSEISVLETLVMPYRQQDIVAEQRYLTFFDTCLNLTVYPLDRAVAQRAAQLRAIYGWLRTPDAIVIATSLLYDAEVLVTNDDRWKGIVELPILVLKDYVPSP